MAKVTNVQVYGLEESVYRSGYPMRTCSPGEAEFLQSVREIRTARMCGDLGNRHWKRAIALANSGQGGDDQYLTGVNVQFDLTMTNKAWIEAERYRFLTFISSMSTMHRAAALPIRECCNAHVSEESVKLAEVLQKRYNEIYPCNKEEKAQAYLDLLYNLPSGFELTAGMTTNYRCLKNIYRQRRKHRLPDWQDVCDWIETLPAAKELICGHASGK